MRLPHSIAPGDTGEVWHVGYEAADGSWADISDAAWVCKVKVIDGPAERTVVARTADNNFFVVCLESAETAVLEPGKFYDARVQISNATLNPPVAREISFPIFMLTPGVT